MAAVKRRHFSVKSIWGPHSSSQSLGKTGFVFSAVSETIQNFANINYFILQKTSIVFSKSMRFDQLTVVWVGLFIISNNLCPMPPPRLLNLNTNLSRDSFLFQNEQNGACPRKIFCQKRFLQHRLLWLFWKISDKRFCYWTSSS